MMECDECRHRWLVLLYPDPDPEDFEYDLEGDVFDA